MRIDERKIAAALKEYSPVSGCIFNFESIERFGIFPPERAISMTDTQIIEWAETKYSRSCEVLLSEVGPIQYRSKLLTEGKEMLKTEGIGGIGIRSRTLEQTEEEIPGVAARLLGERGKIIFLGNGLSDIPLETRTQTAPIVVDIFDYHLLFLDLSHLRNIFSEKDMFFPFQVSYKKCKALSEQIAKGNIIAVNYFVGSKSVPRLLTDAALAINCCGPPIETLEEQVSMLSVNGELYIDRHLFADGNYLTKTLYKGFTPVASILRRK